jgi:TolB-like protein
LRRLALAIAAALGIVGVVVAVTVLALRNGGSDAAAASTVVVMPFENHTTSTALDPLGTVVAEWVTQGLTGVSFLTVLDTRGAQAAARRLGSAAAPIAIGRETGAGVVVAGSYLLQGDSLQFQAQVSSTADGSVLLGIGGVAAPQDRPMEGVELLRQRVVGALASLHNRDVSTFQTTLAQPPTYAAYREYVEGLALYMGEGPMADAAQRFLRAAVLDPTFLTARVWAAQSGMFAGRFEWDETWVRRADSLIAGLQPLKDRLAPFDRARFDFVVASHDSDLLEAYRAALRLVDAAPGSIDARREAAASALRVLHPREALRFLDELDPKRGLMRESEDEYWETVADAHHLLGQYEEELAAARRSRQVHSPELNLLNPELRALAALGRTVELDSAAHVLLAGSSHSGLIAFGIAGELMAHGHVEAAHRLAQYAIDHPGAPPPSEPAAARRWLIDDSWVHVGVGVPYCYNGERLGTRTLERVRDEVVHWRAELALLVGDTQTAARAVAQLQNPDLHNLLQARVLAARGELGAARAALERWEAHALQSQGTLRGLEIDRASVLVRLGDLDRALEVLSEGIGRRPLPNTIAGWDGHAYPDFAPLWTDPRFRALIKPRG